MQHESKNESSIIPKIYLIGVNHCIQFERDDDGTKWQVEIEKFKIHIKNLINEYSIDLLAEEFSKEATVEYNRVEHSLLEKIGENCGVKHLFCDPNNTEQSTLGVSKEKTEKEKAEIRETEWLRRIKQTGKTKILFLCGDDHLASFQSKACESGFACEEKGKSWGKGYNGR